MTGTDLCVRLYKSVPVTFEPPCIQKNYNGTHESRENVVGIVTSLLAGRHGI